MAADPIGSLPAGFSLDSQAPASSAPPDGFQLDAIPAPSPPPPAGQQMLQGAIPHELRGYTEDELNAPGSFQNPRTGQRNTVRDDLARMPVLDAPISGVSQIGAGVEQMAEPGSAEKLRGAGKVVSGALNVATPAMAGVGATAPLSAAAWYAISKGVGLGAQDVAKRAGMNPTDAQETGDVASAVPLAYGFGKVLEGKFSDAIDAHNARAERLVKQDAQQGQGVDLGEHIAGPEMPVGPQGWKVVPQGAAKSGRPNYAVLDANGKPLYAGNGGEVQQWLEVRGVQRTPAANAAAPSAGVVEQARPGASEAAPARNPALADLPLPQEAVADAEQKAQTTMDALESVGNSMEAARYRDIGSRLDALRPAAQSPEEPPAGFTMDASTSQPPAGFELDKTEGVTNDNRNDVPMGRSGERAEGQSEQGEQVAPQSESKPADAVERPALAPEPGERSSSSAKASASAQSSAEAKPEEQQQQVLAPSEPVEQGAVTPQVPSEAGTKYVLPSFATAQYTKGGHEAARRQASSQPSSGWMNRFDIQEKVDSTKEGTVLGDAARHLQAFQELVDEHSDGWPYWKPASTAANRLMGLIQHNPQPTPDDLTYALAPINTFKTKRMGLSEAPAAEPASIPPTENRETTAQPAQPATIEEATPNEPTGASAEQPPGPDTLRAGHPEALADVSPESDQATGTTGQTLSADTGSGQPDDRSGDKAEEPGSPAGRSSRNDSRAVGVSSRGEPNPQPSRGDLSAESGAHDYRLSDADQVGEGTQREKLQANLDAIRAIRKIEAEKRPATDEEKRVLARYSGWGAMPQIFDPYRREWAGAREELQSLLTPEEYEAARASTTNAHYTSPTIVKGIWGALQHLGLTPNASILEPAAGVGNFFGYQPDALLPARRTAIEKDTITGKIAKALYPDSNVQIAPFEKMPLPDDFFDAAVSNVPFGNVGVHDPKYKRTPVATQAIHNYFFVKALDTLRPGGILAFVTSSYTLDAPKWAPLRELLASKADLLGAIRLPNTAFKENAGTEVTTDVIFLKKRAPGEAPAGESWKTLGTVQTPQGKPIPVNEYYARHPDMMLGKMDYTGKQYAAETPTLEGTVTPENFAEAARKLPANAYQPWSATEEAQATGISLFELGDEVKDGGFSVKDGVIVQRAGAMYQPVDVKPAVAARIRAMIPLRKAYREVLRTQLEDVKDSHITVARKRLGTTYDAFVKQHGPLNARANVSALKPDPDFAALQALENYDPETGKATKTQIFSERTIQKPKAAERAERADEALAISLNDLGRIDWNRMQQLTGKTPEELREDLAGMVYRNPAGGRWETADGYLSGNVRDKLEQAEAASAADPSYDPNVEALKRVIPPDLTQEEIRVALGAAWIPPEAVRQFASEVLDQPGTKVTYSPAVATWSVKPAKFEQNRATNTEVWGVPEFYATDLLDMALNNKSPRVWTGPADKRVIDPVRTAAAQAAQDAIRNKFKEWAWQDEKRGKTLAQKYNREFNALRAREFDGAHLTLPGSNPSITLAPHQKNAIWRTIQTGNTLLAHEVGAGKTFEMVASAMELRRLGLARKPMMAVPNHMVEQFTNEWRQLYPNARILTIARSDMGTGKRQVALARIASGNWDGVIVAHSSFGKIGVSDGTFNAYLHSQIAELRAALEEASANSGGDKKNKTVKEIEKSIARLEVKIEKRAKREAKDKSLTFEELGVDQLFVDEAHAFKKLQIVTKRDRIAGIPTGDSQRATDLHMKTEYLAAPSGGKRGVVFATGTPVTNTMAELYNMQRYLQPGALRDLNIQHFDAWANTFAEAVRGVELDVSGKGFRENTRFAKFINLPELIQVFRQIADVKTAAQLKLPRPEVEGGQTEPVTVPATPQLRAFVDDLQERAKTIRGGSVDPRKDNMLKITSEGKKAALDMRLVDPRAEDHPGSKVNTAVRNILRTWKETEKDRRTQMVFCDLSTPKSAKTKRAAASPSKKAEAEADVDDSAENTDPETENTDIEAAGERAGFSVYDDMKVKLVAAGIPSNEIAFIHDAETDSDKQRLFAAVRAGQVRVIFGSTEKMGVGTNVQKRLIELHQLDTPWRPSDITQREGRILRQGNDNPVVRIKQYLTEGSLDAFSWQTITTKAKFIGQAMNGDLNLREAEDIGLVIPSAAEFMAMASGDPIIRENIGVSAELGRLSAQRAGHARQQAGIQRQLAELPSQLGTAKRMASEIKADAGTIEKHKDDGFTIGKRRLTGDAARAQAAAALHAVLDGSRGPGNPQQCGSYRGLQLWTRPGFMDGSYPGVTLRGASSYQANVNPEDPLSTVASIEAVTRNIPGRLPGWEKTLAEQSKKIEELQRQAGKPFPFENRFQDLVKRKAEIDQALALSEAEKAATSAEGDTREEPGANTEARDKGVVLGSGLGALQPYIEKFLKDDVAPSAAQLATVFRLCKTELQAIFAPGSIVGAEATHLAVRANAALFQRQQDRAEAALLVARKYFGAQPDQDNFDFVDRVEHGQAQPTPDLQTVADVMRQMLDSRRELVRALGKGKLDQFIQDYFPHCWEKPNTARTAFRDSGRRPLEGSKSFLKKRSVQTFADGIALGLTPISTNPVDLVIAKTLQMDKYLMAHRILGEMAEALQLKFHRANHPVPEGYAKINDSAATVWGTPSHPGAQQIEGHYIAPEPAARVLNNFLSPGIAERSSLFRVYLGVGNILNQAQLSFSAFHLSFTTLDTITSKLALSFYQAGHGDVLKSLGTAPQALIAPFQAIARGNKLMKEWYAPGTQGARMGQLIDATVQAGGRARMDAVYRTRMTRRFESLVGGMAKQWRKNNPLGAVARGLGATAVAPLVALEQASKPLMEYLVPRYKLAVFADLAQYEMERLGAGATADEVRPVLARAWDSVDNRLGQLVYDNLSWHKTTKDLAMGAVRSVGWNVGTPREILGGAADTIALLKDKVTGGAGGKDVTPRMTYLPALALVAGAAGGLLYYLWHGRAPERLVDYYFPKDNRGQRRSLPTYVKDVYGWSRHPIDTALGKIHPLLRLLWEMLSNKDYYERPIRNIHHPAVKQAEEAAKHMGQAFEPIWMREDRHHGSTSTEEKVKQFLGATPAPKALDQRAR